MCGFVGFLNTPEVGSPENVVRAMADRIIHRGPDDADYYVDEGISLGFRRLSIIDLEDGRQPILNEDGTKVLVFNGEIYNFQSLREDLLKKGHVFKPAPTRRPSSTGTRSTARRSCKSCGACSPLSSGTRRRRSFSAPGIFSASSLLLLQKRGPVLCGLRDQELSLPSLLCEGAGRGEDSGVPVLRVHPL